MPLFIRAKAPLRIGLAGGGTDVSPYSDRFGGAVLNATVSLYVSVTIEPLDDGRIIFNAIDLGESLETDAALSLPINGEMDLLKGIYNRIVSDFAHRPLSFRLTTYSDAPKGSGMGASSTVAVAVIGAFMEWLKLPLGEYDIAHLAFVIERMDLGMAGGKQDQYAATFGGFNFMEFFGDDKVIVNPLRIKNDYRLELENNILLYYTGTSRLSSRIIEKQSANFEQSEKKSLDAAHRLKEQAVRMKEALLTGRLDKIGELLNFGWTYKKQTASEITNPVIDDIYRAAIGAGVSGGKISGAGGGGFMMLYAPGNSRYRVMDALQAFGGQFRPFSFVETGLTTWKG
jgi:D-glycero-alpha-D-manno-heptose-7-phosphate kinase